MQHAAELRRCLSDLDVRGIQRLWRGVSPHLPQPNGLGETLAAMHLSRTQLDAIEFRKRAYSHAWLTERGLPSDLPDHLRPRAHRLYPVVMACVGISANSSSPVPERKQFARVVQGAMENRVNDMYADGIRDPLKVKPAIMDARAGIYRKLLGIKL